MTDTVIEVHDLTKRYGRATAVDGVSFTVQKGEIFGLLGPNGAGKTTTILMMLGLTDVTSGSVSVMGYDPVRQPLQVKRVVGYLPDTVGFYDYMTAVRQSALHRGADRHPVGRSRQAHRLGARPRRPRGRRPEAVGDFSRGMRQRLGLAEILMKDASIAILDEPTSGLDPHATAELLEMIRSLKRDGVAVLVSSHLLERVQSICDRVALFNAGKIALLGTVPELARQVLGGGYNVEVEAEGEELAVKLSELSGREGGRSVRPEPLPAAGRDATCARRPRPRWSRPAARSAGCRSRSLSLDAIYNRYFQNQQQERPHAAA